MGLAASLAGLARQTRRSTVRRWNSVVVVVVALMATALTACAGDDQPAGGNVCEDMTTEYEGYSDGLTKLGDNGTLKVRLLSAEPAPPERGDNRWTLQLLSMSDQPLPNATVTGVKPFMPDHGHGSGTTAVIGATNGNGEVTVDSIDLMMPGVWTITVDVDNAATTDTATFAFCIDG